MDPRIEHLETRVAFLDQANAQLSDEIYRLTQQLDSVREQLALLAGRLEAAQDAPTAYASEDEKPPHY